MKECTRCHVRAIWSAKMCWECHQAYARAIREDANLGEGLARGLAVGVALVAGAVGIGAPGFVVLAIAPIAMAFSSTAARRHRRAWIARTGPALPEARLVTRPEP